MTDFKQWMIDNYSHNELADIANHGCSGGVSGMIYYTETANLYKRFSDDLHEVLAEYHDAVGQMPAYVTDELGDFVRFSNAVVWFAAEWVAQSLTHFGNRGRIPNDAPTLNRLSINT